MKLTLLAFAQSRETFGFSEKIVDFDPSETPRQLLDRIAPGVGTAGLRVALDCDFVAWDAPLGEVKEMALLPPVSGG